MTTTPAMRFDAIHPFIDELFEGDVHAKRVYALANATLGVLASSALAVHAIGQGLAASRGLVTKPAIKQIDRLLSNTGVEVSAYFTYWVPYVIGERRAIGVFTVK